MFSNGSIKAAGAFLAVVFVLMSVSLLSDAIFASHAPEKEGFAIEAQEGSGAAPKEEVALALIQPLLASADIAAGEKVFKKCASCHNVADGAANKVGPNLWGIIGQAAGSVDGFSYSSALTAYAEGGKKWEFENMNAFLLKPKAYIKGTAMGFAGLKKEADRANIIAYLNAQSGAPVPVE